MTDSQNGGARSYRSMQADGQAELERLAGRRPDGRIDWDARWHAAAAWCQEHLPDLIDNRGVTCGFAVGSALALKSELARIPTADEVRRRRGAWMRRLQLDDVIAPASREARLA
jgi:hypothetical protein